MADFTTHEVVGGFIDAMSAAGMPPSEPISERLLDGTLIRFRVGDDKPGRRNGWAVLHLDGTPAGAFGCNKRQIDETWRFGVARAPLSKAEKRAFAQQLAAKRREAEEATIQRHDAASMTAAGLWRDASVADPAHPYLVRKGVCPDKLRLRQVGAKLLVPMYNGANAIRNLQSIDGTGLKLFQRGAEVEGLMWVAGRPNDTICVGEGFATMARIYQSTQIPSVAAFTAGNLPLVATSIRSMFPQARIIICADDDAHLVGHPQIQRNIGVEAAEEAALGARALIAMPPRPFGLGCCEPWDFADIADPRVVAEAIEPFLHTDMPTGFGSIRSRLGGLR